MDSATRQALEDSIAHWDRMASGNRVNYELPYGEYCALCEKFDDEHQHDGCAWCPVKEKTLQKYCEDTPYYEARDEYNRHGIDSDEFKAAAAKERDFLISLREED